DLAHPAGPLPVREALRAELHETRSALLRPGSGHARRLVPDDVGGTHGARPAGAAAGGEPGRRERLAPLGRDRDHDHGRTRAPRHGVGRRASPPAGTGHRLGAYDARVDALAPIDLRFGGRERVIGVYLLETEDGPALFDCRPA